MRPGNIIWFCCGLESILVKLRKNIPIPTKKKEFCKILLHIILFRWKWKLLLEKCFSFIELLIGNLLIILSRNFYHKNKTCIDKRRNPSNSFPPVNPSMNKNFQDNIAFSRVTKNNREMFAFEMEYRLFNPLVMSHRNCLPSRCSTSCCWTPTGPSMPACGCGCRAARFSSNSSTATVQRSLAGRRTRTVITSGNEWISCDSIPAFFSAEWSAVWCNNCVNDATFVQSWWLMLAVTWPTNGNFNLDWF